MSSLDIAFHPRASGEFAALATSEDENEQLAAAQLLVMVELLRSSAAVRDRLLTYHESIYVRNPDGTTESVNIRIIEDLKDIAEDSRFHTDAVRRIKDLSNKPADEYRVFFAPRQRKGAACDVLGVFPRDVAYEPQTLAELKWRYENPRST